MHDNSFLDLWIFFCPEKESISEIDILRFMHHFYLRDALNTLLFVLIKTFQSPFSQIFPWSLATKPARPGKVTFKTLYGSWGLRFPKLNFNIVFKPGKVTLNGKSIRVVPSKNKKYSVKLGWFTFVYRGWTYYIRKYRNRIYTFRMDKKGRITKGSVGKGGK